MKEKKYYRLKSPTSLLIPAIGWIFTILYLNGSKNVLWSDGFLAMRVCVVLLAVATVMVVKNEILVMTEEEYKNWNKPAISLSPAMKKNLIMYAALAVYLMVLNFLGFFIATWIFAVVIMLWLGVRNVPVLVLVPVITAGVLFYVFKYLLYIRLPLGLLKYIL